MIFQMVAVAIPRELFLTILERIESLRMPVVASGYGKDETNYMRIPKNTEEVSSQFHEKNVFQAQTASSDPRNTKKQTTKAEKQMKNLEKPLSKKKIHKNHPDSP